MPMLPHRVAKSKHGEAGRRVSRSRSLLRLLPQPARDDQAARREKLPAAPVLAEHVAEIELALDRLEDARIADRTDREVAEIAASERRRRCRGTGPDDRG